MRTSRLIKHLGNVFLILSFLLLIFFATQEKDQQPIRTRDRSFGGRGGKNFIVKQALEGDYDYYGNDEEEKQDLWIPDGPLEPPDTVDESKNQSDQVYPEEVVVVVVAPDVDNGIIEYKNEFVETLEEPDKPVEVAVDDKDMLRENDVIEGNMVIDRSDDLLLNDSISNIGEAMSLDFDSSDSEYYSGIELLPTLKKPPSEINEPGEFGHPFQIPFKQGLALGPLMAQGFLKYGFNTVVSDIISPHRNLGDKREDECKEKKYKKPLPGVSVIICFRNEVYSVLRRTLYSVLETVPSLLLEEIILVDDNSRSENTADALKKEVDEFSDIVKLIRAPKTLGIAKARLRGLRKAKGEVVAFLDSHCECYEGWLEPLLDRIRHNNKTIAMPVIEIIDKETFAFGVTPMKTVQRGGFDWTLTYRWIAPSRTRYNDPNIDLTSPIETPTLSGGVFLADRKSFLQMGSYDEGMDIWGAENLEISFKTWMCGGQLEIVPCSHVGHIFRNRVPEAADLETVLHNKKRIAEVWLDDYKNIFYKRLPYAMEINAGNITARKNLRTKLQCKPFEWYLENIYPELYIPELHPQFSGAICCNFGGGAQICLDTHNDDAIPGRLLCVDSLQKNSATQYFEYTKQNEIRQTGSRDVCLGAKGDKVEVQRCAFPVDESSAPKTQRWKLTEENMIVNVATSKCLTAATKKVWLEECDQSNRIRQTWNWL